MIRFAAVAAVGALALAGCSNANDASADTASPPAEAALTVTVSHYPVQFLVERIGGDAVAVENLTTPGAEPHDLELTPQQVAELQDASTVFYLGGFQPALEDAVPEANGTVVDLTEGLTLREAEAHTHDEEHADGEEHADEEEHGSTDPHVWLSPVLMQQMATTVADTLSEQSPENQQVFADNAAQLQNELEALNTEWTDGTANCEIRTMVVSHEAFGYLADQYGFDQRGISGLSPENEPSAAAIAELTTFVRDNGITTVYTEELVDPSVAETIAAEAGVQTALLSTLETQPEDGDYFSAMRSNLETVSAGQSCS
jgi:zinc transport system substrate-binding protein